MDRRRIMGRYSLGASVAADVSGSSEGAHVRMDGRGSTSRDRHGYRAGCLWLASAGPDAAVRN